MSNPTTIEHDVDPTSISPEVAARRSGKSHRLPRWLTIVRDYPLPIVVAVLIALSVALDRLGFAFYSDIAALAAILIGAAPLVIDTFDNLRHGRYALDYIALLAIITALVTGEELVGAVVTLMMLGGETLEKYGVQRAKRSLTYLADRIPNIALVEQPDRTLVSIDVDAVEVGARVVVRHGEVIPLDGTLHSEFAQLDESSLTGEPYLDEKVTGDDIRSGTVNLGQTFTITVSKPAGDSTYRRILKMVEDAQTSGAPLVRLADRYSVVFTVLAISLAGIAWLVSGEVSRALAVLVVATPCPLILATPIALMGGMNRAAQEKIIVKQLASLEVLSRLNALIFDKTGTITVGRPELVDIELAPDSPVSSDEALAIAAAIERRSLHPIAKAIVEAAKQRNLPARSVSDVHETVGKGIEAMVANRRCLVARVVSERQEMRVGLSINGTLAATFVLEDRVKEGVRDVFQRIARFGIEISIATGDRRAAAERAVQTLGLPVAVESECTPEAKSAIISAQQAAGRTVGMVGDGINDAPALAQANVGIVFAHEEQTAASEAADVVILGGDVTSVWRSIVLARSAVTVARQGILAGIGLSTVAMLFAAAGLISPYAGAFLQEGIDLIVIVNALRATTGRGAPFGGTGTLG